MEEAGSPYFHLLFSTFSGVPEHMYISITIKYKYN